MKHLLFLIVSVICGAQVPPACNISVNKDITDPQPLILRPPTTLNGNDAYFLPTSGDIVSFSEGETLNVVCPGGRVLVSGTNTQLDQVQATCRSGKFNIANQTVLFGSITCSAHAVHNANYTGASCLTKFREIEIVFVIGARFIKHITICFDPTAQNSLYSRFDLTSAIDGYQVNYPRPNWIQGPFYNLGSNNLDTLYTRNTQRTTINALLGLPPLDTTYIHATNDYYLSRGHLTAKADFVFGSQHRLTFYFVNAAPQWQTFNGGNWNTLEDNVRTFAASRRLNLEVHTGTHGVTTLPHASTNASISLYLYVNGTTRAIPVPQYFWKIVYNPTNRLGIAFVGVNNPYREAYTSQDTICPNICNQINWKLTWKPTDVKLGYSYCCSVAELRKVVPTIPSFTVSGVLI